MTVTTPSGKKVRDKSHALVAKLGCAEWGGSYFTFSTENNETIWAFLKKCHQRGKVYMGHDVMPWSGQAGRRTARWRWPTAAASPRIVRVLCVFPSGTPRTNICSSGRRLPGRSPATSPVAVNPELDYLRIRTTRDNSVYYFAKDNLELPAPEREFKEGFGRPEWGWPKGTPKLKTIAQIFKEQGGFETLETVKEKT